ncbi:hypothetical protein [Nostoc sp.]
MWYSCRISTVDFAIKAFSETIVVLRSRLENTVIRCDTQTDAWMR